MPGHTAQPGDTAQPGQTARDRLILPVAAVLAAALVCVPVQPAGAVASPRFAEVTTLRLQAEVTSLVTGVAATGGAAQPAAAAGALSGTGTTGATLCTYPCTIFDKFLSALPANIRYAILPTLYVAASVLGLLLAPVMLVTSALFSWPTSLRPAAATTPENTPAPKPAPAPALTEVAALDNDPVRPHTDPEFTPSVPAATTIAGDAAEEGDSTGGEQRRGSGRQRTAEAVTDPAENPVSPEAVAPDAPVTADVAPADNSTDAETVEVEAAAAEALAPVEKVSDDDASAVSAHRMAKAERATAAGESAPEAARAARRSVR